MWDLKIKKVKEKELWFRVGLEENCTLVTIRYRLVSCRRAVVKRSVGFQRQ